MKANFTDTKYKELGFTLIELMVSLALGLVIMLAAMQLFITNQINFNLQRGMGNVQENGRFAIDYINTTVRNSEYAFAADSDDYLASGIITDVTQLQSMVTAAQKLISSNDDTELGVGKSDQLVVRQWVSARMTDLRDCEGNTIIPAGSTTGRFVVSRYFVRADTPAGPTAALACDAGTYSEGDASVTGYGGDGVVLLSTIDSFQVLLGVAATPTPPSGERFPVRYMTISDYAALAAGARPVISALRVGVLVRSSESTGESFGAPPDVQVLDKSVPGNDINDKRVHRLFTSTLALRNAI